MYGHFEHARGERLPRLSMRAGAHLLGMRVRGDSAGVAPRSVLLAQPDTAAGIAQDFGTACRNQVTVAGSEERIEEFDLEYRIVHQEGPQGVNLVPRDAHLE